MPLAERLLLIIDQLHGSYKPSVAVALYKVGMLFHRKGDYPRAKSLYQKSLETWEWCYWLMDLHDQAPSKDQSGMSPVLSKLASLYKEMLDYTRAEKLYLRNLKVIEDARGPNNLEVVPALNDLATLYKEKRDYTGAEKFYLRSLKITEDVRGPNDLEMAPVLGNLATLYKEKGDYKRAEESCRRSLKIREDALGPKHPEVATVLTDLAALSLANGKITESVKLLTRGGDIDEYNAGRILLTGSEEQKKLYMGGLMYRSDFDIAFHLQYARSNPEAAELAINSILRTKGRVLEAMRDSYGALSRRLGDEDRKTFEKLRSVTGDLQALVYKGPGKGGQEVYQKEFNRLKEAQDGLEQEMSLRSAEVRVETQPVTLGVIQRAIPKNVALVEVATYHSYDIKTSTWGEPRYAAYVLWEDRGPAWVDLGKALPIDQGVAKLRRALSNPRRSDVKVLARSLDELTMRPIRRLLGNARTVLLSPDGALNLIPFGALVDEKNQYLVKEFSFIYLTSGRDLLRMQTTTSSRTGPVIFANPYYSLYGVDFSKPRWPPLPGTSDEADALKGLLPGATVYEKEKATEEVLKKVSGPEILHVATHGFFKDRTPEKETPGKAAELGPHPSRNDLSPQIDSPLLRSGLVLAGANSPPKWSREDGVITALEIADLDLWGTRLVVLSACETGLGEVQTGEGVYGLRRSLVVSGSESQVISLWDVGDDATQHLMTAFYRNLKAGVGRAEALRKEQRDMAGSKHPYYWASFIASGDWRPIDWEPREKPQTDGESAAAQGSSAPETLTAPSTDKGNPTEKKAEKPGTSRSTSSGFITGQVVKVSIDEDIIVVKWHKKVTDTYEIDAYDIKDVKWTGHYKDEKDVCVGDGVAVKYIVKDGKKIAKEIMGLSRVCR